MQLIFSSMIQHNCPLPLKSVRHRWINVQYCQTLSFSKTSSGEDIKWLLSALYVFYFDSVLPFVPIIFFFLFDCFVVVLFYFRYLSHHWLFLFNLRHQCPSNWLNLHIHIHTQRERGRGGGWGRHRLSYRDYVSWIKN